jgi:hypothetical protein
LVSYIPARDGKNDNLFYSVALTYQLFFYSFISILPEIKQCSIRE